jgi:hypothetical protein
MPPLARSLALALALVVAAQRAAPARAQLAAQEKLLDDLVQQAVQTRAVTFATLVRDFSVADAHALAAAPEWSFLAASGGYFSVCSMRSQRARRSVVRKVEYALTVIVRNDSIGTDTLVWEPGVQTSAADDAEQKPRFAVCPIDRAGAAAAGGEGDRSGNVGGLVPLAGSTAQVLAAFSNLSEAQHVREADPPAVVRVPPFMSGPKLASMCNKRRGGEVLNRCWIPPDAVDVHGSPGRTRPMEMDTTEKEDILYMDYEPEAVVVEFVATIALAIELALVSSILQKARALRLSEWFVIALVMSATVFQACFSAWQTLRRLARLRVGWQRALVLRYYILEDGGRALDIAADLTVIDSSVPWTSKLIIAPIVAVATVVLCTILALVTRRMLTLRVGRRPGPVDPIARETAEFKAQQLHSSQWFSSDYSSGRR